ncbi:MAG: hypothetical protein IPN19_14555 [Elusimicrobia bacterium]|nr:hypothetical protein [Elusimicrobiota bacterium]
MSAFSYCESSKTKGRTHEKEEPTDYEHKEIDTLKIIQDVISGCSAAREASKLSTRQVRVGRGGHRLAQPQHQLPPGLQSARLRTTYLALARHGQ